MDDKTTLPLEEVQCQVTLFRCPQEVLWICMHNSVCKIFYCEEHANKVKRNVMSSYITGTGLRCRHCLDIDIQPADCHFVRI